MIEGILGRNFGFLRPDLKVFSGFQVEIVQFLRGKCVIRSKLCQDVGFSGRSCPVFKGKMCSKVKILILRSKFVKILILRSKLSIFKGENVLQGQNFDF